jgi:hypothetical protein
MFIASAPALRPLYYQVLINVQTCIASFQRLESFTFVEHGSTPVVGAMEHYFLVVN